MDDLHGVDALSLCFLFGVTVDAVAQAQRHRPGLLSYTGDSFEGVEEDEAVWDV